MSLPDESGPGRESDPDQTPSAPPVFVRGLTAGPAMPWDQARAAHLEARLNAPLPLADVVYLVQRLEPWRPGAQGRFGAVYVRRRDVGEGLTVQPQLNGKTIKAQFASAAGQKRRFRQLGLAMGGSAIGAFLLITLTASIWTSRVETAERLESLEQQVQARIRQTNSQAQAAAQVRALDDQGLRNRQAANVLADLSWAAQARDPATTIEAFHWQGGLLAVEVRGDTAPFLTTDRSVRRAVRPLRRGVWLWGVENPAPAAAGATP